jgi:tRNA(Leu) C34 or U34 (ribose-2'-O)-methylase TrmL
MQAQKTFTAIPIGKVFARPFNPPEKGYCFCPAARLCPCPTYFFAPMMLLGSESSGVPQNIHDEADLRIRIPMRAGFRSLNLSVTAGIALAEALRQTGQFPVETQT